MSGTIQAKKVIYQSREGPVELGPCTVIIEPSGAVTLNKLGNDKLNLRGFPQDCNDIVTHISKVEIYL